MEAFELADKVRYLDDTKLRTLSIDPKAMDSYEAGLALNSLKISKEITPEIYKSLEQTCSNLKLDIKNVNAYVTSSPEIQAGCMGFNKQKCVITVTSAIINLLDFEEMKFVFGHELGHFLLNHNIEEIELQESKEGYIKKRAQEISVDRLGLMACKDINVATGAIVKTLSGLDNKYMNFDMKAFLSQLDGDIVKNDNSSQYSSHPSFILRAKALIRFSLSDPYLQLTQESSGTHLKEIDKLIQDDLDTFTDKDLRIDIKMVKELVYFWGYAYAYVKDGEFSKEDQLNLEIKFDTKRTEKLKNMLRSFSSKDDVISNVKSKFVNSITDLKKIAPNLAKKEINLIIQEIAEDSGQKDLFKEIVIEI
ncbi:M48 family metallopeptidase [Gammaproteobacteria bacterium]|nr:M48 family metallopeptidase [Gammaproteobacteria bacterium]